MNSKIPLNQIYDFSKATVICDESNNTKDSIESGFMIVDIYVPRKDNSDYFFRFRNKLNAFTGKNIIN